MPAWFQALGLVIFISVAPGCGGDDGPADAAGSIPSRCCAIEEPTCNCFRYGGTREGDDPQYGCPTICDAEPDGWTQSVDENGCPVLEWGGGTGSCLSPPDAAVPDAAVPDAS